MIRSFVVVLSLIVLVACGGSRSSEAPAPRGTAPRARGKAADTAETAKAAPPIRATPETTVAWQITVRPDLSLDERVCWSGFPANAVVPEMREAIPLAQVTTDEGARVPMTEAGASVSGSRGCVHVAMNLRGAARALADETALTAIESAVFGSLDIWLWRPEPWPEGLHGNLVVDAAPGVTVSLPFPKDERGAYIVRRSVWSLMARSAFGAFPTETVAVPGGELAVAFLPGAAEAATHQGVRRFLEGAARAVSTLDGKMPRERVQIMLLPAGPRGDPVRFGMSMQGGGGGVMLLVSSTATDAKLYGEWVAVHELSHQWMPSFQQNDATWLPEGFASYYQCVLRSRVGMYGEAAAWDELTSGFDRGRAQAKSTGGGALADVRRPRFQHMYWGGAAIMLKLDVLLRQNGSSLDAVVATMRRTYDDDDTTSTELLARLSKTAGRDLGSLVAAWSKESFPDVSSELRELGVVQRGGTVVLDDNAPLAGIRRAIAQKRE